MDPTGDAGILEDDDSVGSRDTLEENPLRELEYFLPEMRRKMTGPCAEPPVINLPWMRSFRRDHFFSTFLSSLIRHPRDFMATLVRLGFEPLPGSTATSLLSRQPQLRLPGLFAYLGYIVKTDGLAGLYRGLHYNIAYSISYDFVYKNVNGLIIEKVGAFESVAENPEGAFTSFRAFAINLVREMGARVVAHMITYPLKVLVIRSMSQFIGGETAYDSWSGAIGDVWSNGGLTGFYSGLVPFCLADCVFVAARWSVYYLLQDRLDHSKRTSIFLVTTLLADSMTNPFRTVATVMVCNGPGARTLAAANYTGPAYYTWAHCLASLWLQGEASRGGSLFWRTRPLPKSLGEHMDLEAKSMSLFGLLT